EIKSLVVGRLVELKVLEEFGGDGGAGLRHPSAEAHPAVSASGRGEGQVGADAEAEAEAEVKAALPPFEPFSPVSSGSREDTRLRMETQEKMQARQAELDLQLEVRRLEIEADKE
ncbi:hypothetical protein M9458_035418, partial [Cirrhinus mrigala]